MLSQAPPAAYLATSNMASLSPSTRAPSPSRISVASRKSGFGDLMRPFSAFSRNRGSVSHSVLSFAPSGSMIDMHVGLSQDRELQQGIFATHNQSTPSISNQMGSPGSPRLLTPRSPLLNTMSISQDETTALRTPSPRKEKKRRKGLKGLLVKLGLARTKSSGAPGDSTVPVTPSSLSASGLMTNRVDDEPLAPPPSLSVLAREQQRHRRNPSALSLPLSTGRGFRPRSMPGQGSPGSQYEPMSPATNLERHTTAYLSSLSPNDLAEELNVPDSRVRSQSEDQLGLTPLTTPGATHLPLAVGEEEMEQVEEWQQPQPRASMVTSSPSSLRSLMSRSFSMAARRRTSVSSEQMMPASKMMSSASSVGGGNRPAEYLPNEKSRKVSRSSDFLALRYLGSSSGGNGGGATGGDAKG